MARITIVTVLLMTLVSSAGCAETAVAAFRGVAVATYETAVGMSEVRERGRSVCVLRPDEIDDVADIPLELRYVGSPCSPHSWIATVLERSESLRACGAVDVSFTIGPDGVPSEIEPRRWRSSCQVEAVGRWRFPPVEETKRFRIVGPS